MATKTLSRSYYHQTTNIETELTRLRSFVIGLAGRDPEGDYRPEFVERILKASSAPPTETFLTAEDFLKQVRQV